MNSLHPRFRPLWLVAVLCLTSAGAHAAPRKKAPAKPAAAAKPSSAAASGEVELVHELGSDKGAELGKIVDIVDAEDGERVEIFVE